MDAEGRGDSSGSMGNDAQEQSSGSHGAPGACSDSWFDDAEAWEQQGQGRQGYWHKLLLTPVLPSTAAAGAGEVHGAAAAPGIGSGWTGAAAASARVLGSSVWSTVGVQRDVHMPDRNGGASSSRALTAGAAPPAPQPVQLPPSVQQVLQAAAALGVAPLVLDRASSRLQQMLVTR
jgi:hypothetical protein